MASDARSTRAKQKKRPHARKRRGQRRVKATDHAAIPLLEALDDKLAAALSSSAIKLVDADFLRSSESEAILPKILRRQALEAMETRRWRRVRIFLSPAEAVAVLRAKDRSVCGQTYGWTSADDPDVTGMYLTSIRRFLRSELGAHVTAVFWECEHEIRIGGSELA